MSTIRIIFWGRHGAILPRLRRAVKLILMGVIAVLLPLLPMIAWVLWG